MARRDDEREGRDWRSEGRTPQTQEERERGRWSREARGEQGRRTEYDRPTGGGNRGGYERERFDAQADWREPDAGEPRDDSEWSEYRGSDARRGGDRYDVGDRDERYPIYGDGAYGDHRGRPEAERERWSRGGYRGGAQGYGREGYRGGSAGGPPSGGNWGGGERGYRGRPERETYGETQRWERTPVDMGGSYGGGAYAGGAYGGGAWGPGGFGSHGRSTGMWEGVAGSGHAPGWARDTDHPSRTGRDYSGRGPKGYQRSNERITEDVCDALTRNPDVDASEISVRCENGEVILSGSVHDRYEKRLAEDVAERVSGVMEVRNEIRVYRPTEGESDASAMRRGSSESRTGEDGREDEQTRRGSSSSRNRSGSRG